MLFVNNTPKTVVAVLLVIAVSMPSAAISAERKDGDWRQIQNKAVEQYGSGKFNQAVKTLRKALAAAEKRFGPDHENTAASLYLLAEIYTRQERYALAEPQARRALAIVERNADKTDISGVLSCLAEDYRGLGDYQQAEQLAKRALAITKKRYGPWSPNAATSMNNLAFIFQSQAQYAQAEPLYKQAVAIWKKHKYYPGMTSGLANLAELYYLQRKYAQAEVFYTRARAVGEEAFGPIHPNVAAIIENQSRLYRTIKQTAKAEKLEQRAADIRSIKR
jgi:tetratricopeptide (TPR) repeat protein